MDILQMNQGSIVRKLLILTCLLVASIGFRGAVYGQTPSASPATSAVSGVIGEVKAIDAAAKQMVVRDDKGVIFSINLSDKTQYKRMAPGEKTMASAADITLADVGQGDRVWARWRAGSDQKTVPTTQVVVMSKADVAKKQEQERTEWRRRGVSGIVTSVNPSTKEITVSSRSLMGAQQAVIIPITDKVLMRRYPPDTIPKYSEAKPSTRQSQNQGQAAQRPQGAGPGGPQGGGPRMGGGGPNVADILERLPTISISEVKVGDMVIMSSLPGSDPTQFTAISLVTGVEPLLTMVAARQQTGGAQGRPQGVDLNGSFGGMFGGVGVP